MQYANESDFYNENCTFALLDNPKSVWFYSEFCPDSILIAQDKIYYISYHIKVAVRYKQIEKIEKSVDGERPTLDKFIVSQMVLLSLKNCGCSYVAKFIWGIYFSISKFYVRIFWYMFLTSVSSELFIF